MISVLNTMILNEDYILFHFPLDLVHEGICKHVHTSRQDGVEYKRSLQQMSWQDSMFGRVVGKNLASL